LLLFSIYFLIKLRKYLDVNANNEISFNLVAGVWRNINHAIFYDSINHDAREGKNVIPRGTPVIIYASCQKQDEGPGGHYAPKPQ